MVLFGGLELVAAGYLVHRHQKNKKERERRNAEAIHVHYQQQQQPQQQQQQQELHFYYHHQQHQQQQKQRRRHPCSYSRPCHTSKPNYPPTSYHYQKPTHHTLQPEQAWRPQQSCVSPSQMPVAGSPAPQHQYRQSTWPQPHAPEQGSGPRPVQQSPVQQSYTSNPYSSAHPLAITSTPNLPHGYQANTGLSDDTDRLSIDGLETYQSEEAHPSRVHFALSDEPQPGDHNDPPPPYRP